MPIRRAPILPTFAVLSVLAPLVAVPSVRGQEARPWDLLEQVRDELSGNGPLQASFRQSYVPAGFESGETEGGTLALALPDCLRWDYTWPYAKTYLLCGGQVYSWNAGEASGRRYAFDRQEAPGMDLLLLGVEQLRKRYEATLLAGAGDTRRVHLVPRRPVADLTEAVFTIDADEARLTALEWRDQEGSLTRFELSDHRPLGQLELFSPPDDLQWIGE